MSLVSLISIARAIITGDDCRNEDFIVWALFSIADALWVSLILKVVAG